MSSTTNERLFMHALSMGGGMRQKELERIARKVEDLSDRFESMSDEELGGMTAHFRERHRRGEELDELLPEAFAAVREASGRTLGMRHFPVQLMGGVVLHRGMIAEMKGGEGKTLVAPLAAYLNAIPGRGVHVVTVNDYLAKRDSEWMGKVYGFLGMSVGCLQNDMDRDERRDAYAADVTYGTNSEFGFDYLRDHMV
ncbi:MAG: preprotein translocase subunit SecA, partial [Olsenella sp.]